MSRHEYSKVVFPNGTIVQVSPNGYVLHGRNNYNVPAIADADKIESILRDQFVLLSIGHFITDVLYLVNCIDEQDLESNIIFLSDIRFPIYILSDVKWTLNTLNDTCKLCAQTWTQAPCHTMTDIQLVNYINDQLGVD